MASKNTESLDTNIILRLILEDDEKLYRHAAELLECPNVKYYISDFAVLEIVFVLSKIKTITREEIVGAIFRILSRPNIRSNLALFVPVFHLYVNHPKLSLADCYMSLEAGLKNRTPFWTFDQALAKQSPTAKLLA